MFFWRRRHAVRDEELSAYLDGALAAAAGERVEAHLAACAACREKLAELRAVRSALRALPRMPAPRAFTLGEADLRPAPRGVGALGPAPALLSAVAVAAFVAFGALTSVDVLTMPSAEEAAPAAFEAEEAAGGEERAPRATAPEERDGGAAYVSPGEERSLGATATPPMAPNALDAEGLREPPAEAEQHPAAGGPSPPATPTPEPVEPAEEADGAPVGLRAAEAATAALGTVALASLAFVWWRRRMP